MGFVPQFKSDLFNSPSFDFKSECLRIFQFQYLHNEVYRDYILQLNLKPENITEIEQIPFLPITFFKNFRITSVKADIENYFESSGTTDSIRSRLYYSDKQFYLDNCVNIFENFFGSLSGYSFYFLLPSYLERQNSSLVAMANHFHSLSNKDFGGFYLHDFELLNKDLNKATEKKNTKVILWGVTFALLDFAEQFGRDYPDLIVFETGGMKGRGKEPLRSEVHSIISRQLHVKEIHSEYGMTELFSQAYSSDKSDVFICPPQMRVLIREPEDPLNVHSRKMERGGVNVIDLANVDSCSFIETQDLGVLTEDGFQILGRFDNSEVRGCNLLVLST